MISFTTLSSVDVNRLAVLAESSWPDSTTSDGAAFLRSVRVAVGEAVSWEVQENGRSLIEALNLVEEEGAQEIADGAVPIYTSTLWATFLDLQAYQEDVTDVGEITDLTRAAQVALYLIAHRLVTALLTAMRETAEEDEQD